MGPTLDGSTRRGAPDQARPDSFQPNTDPVAHGSFVVFVRTQVFALDLGGISSCYKDNCTRGPKRYRRSPHLPLQPQVTGD